MVVVDVNNLESDFFEITNKNIKSNNDLLKSCLKGNEKVDDKLHVITVISNICNFKRRWQLMIEFIDRIKQFKNIELYVVELIYENQIFRITDPNNPNHLQLKTEHALWHKENMINLGIEKLLPKDWKSVAWIDGDIEFENLNWVDETLKVLTKFDLVQLFTTCFDLDENNIPMSIWQSYGYKYCQGETFKHNKGINYWHSGYGWACTRDFYNRIGKIYDKGIIGSGDYILTQAIIGNIASADKSLTEFKNEIIEYKEKINNYDIKIGYISTNIKHYFHGSKINRKYIERNQILIKHRYNPLLHLEYNNDGILVPTKNMSEEFIKDIKDYFFQRNEDEFYDIIYKDIKTEIYYFNLDCLNKSFFESIIYVEHCTKIDYDLSILLMDDVITISLKNGIIKVKLTNDQYDELVSKKIISVKSFENTEFYENKNVFLNIELQRELNLVKLTFIYK
jgi:hypothetical protein